MGWTLTIDGKDARTEYKCVLRAGAAKALLEWPELKGYDSNDWHEHDGIEADLSAPVLDARQLELPLYFSGTDGYKAFFAALATTSYHTVGVEDIGYSKRLRYISAGAPIIVRDMILVSVTFSDDFPLEGYEYSEPGFDALENDVWSLDGRKMSKYGVRILEGTRNSVWQMPAVKENLTRNISTLAGVIHDDHASVSASSSVTLRCYMSGPSVREVAASWKALLYDLTRPGARTLAGDLPDGTMSVAYGSSAVSDVAVKGGLHIVFTIVLTTLINN